MGDRPLRSLTLYLDGAHTPWNNPLAPVFIRIPHSPTAAEAAADESLVIWHVDDDGGTTPVPSGRYDAETGGMTFRTTHFSDFATVLNEVRFRDVSDASWYGRAVRFIAARGITLGDGLGHFMPSGQLTRGDFLVMLMRACDIAPDNASEDNFSDAGNNYQTGYLAAAKRLGLAKGVGDNCSRQTAASPDRKCLC
jgi:hypothetical protein